MQSLCCVNKFTIYIYTHTHNYIYPRKEADKEFFLN